MYGHYEGTLSMNGDSPEVGNAQPLSISMARVIARVEMNIKLAENVNIPDGYHIFSGCIMWSKVPIWFLERPII